MFRFYCQISIFSDYEISIDNMSVNCHVELFPYNVSLPPNNATVDSVQPNNIDVNNATKRSTRTTRKRIIHDKSVIGDNDDQSVNVKNEKCMIKKAQFEENDLEKSVTCQKDHKKKCQRSPSIKNNTTNSNNSKVPIKYKNYESTNSLRISLKTKSKKSKSISAIKKKSIMNNINKDDTLDDIEISNDFITSNSPKKKSSKSVTSVKKKSTMNNLEIDDIFNGNNDITFPQKRGRSTLKKVQSPKTGVNICNDKNSQKNKSWSIVFDKLNNIREPQISENVDDNNMMLRSNNKPPKIKKKWSDEWSGNKLSNIIKSNDEDFMHGQKIDTNNCSKIKKVLKTQKPNNAKHNKLKTEELSTDSNTCHMVEIVDKPTTHIPETQQNDDSVLITNNIPTVRQEVVESNIQINSSNSNTVITSSSEVTAIPHTEIFNSVLSNENDQPSHLSAFESISDSSNLFVPMMPMSSECPEISYGISILSEAISRQCNELNNKNSEIKLPEHINDKKLSPNKTNMRLQVPSAKVSPQRIQTNMSNNEVEYASELCEQSFENKSQSNIEHQIHILSKRFDIPFDSLRKTVLEEPLLILQKHFCESVNSSMVKIVPLIESETNLNLNCTSKNSDINYKIDPMKEIAAYEKSNLKDLMEELTKTMPSWSLSIVPNPSRYVISHMSIDTYGIPIANKSIVLDKYFRALVYVNQCLMNAYCKRYSTAYEIINLIKDLSSI